MVNYTFYLVDVFAQEKYAGNQLAVVINTENLSAVKMQKIAKEFNYSETTFVNPQSERGYEVRIFTPSTEVPFAGHPTLGTAYIIRHFIERRSPRKVLLNLEVGEIPVTFKKDLAWMKQKTPTFGKTFPTDFLQNLLGLQPQDFDLSFPIQEVSTGLPFVIVPLKTLESVKHARINQTFLPQLLKQVKAGVLVFSPQTYKKENTLNVRVFVDVFGIPEDPATGSGNGCLAAYLTKYRYFGNKKLDISVEQGFEINRPAILHLKANSIGDSILVEVGGQVQLVAKGELMER